MAPPEGADGKLSTLLDGLNAAFRSSTFKQLDELDTVTGSMVEDSVDAAVLSLRSKHSELRDKLKLLEMENAALKRGKNAEEQERAELVEFRTQLEARVLNMEQENIALMVENKTMKQEKNQLEARVLKMEQENIGLMAENKTMKQEKVQLEAKVLNMEQENIGLMAENKTIKQEKFELEARVVTIKQLKIHLEALKVELMELQTPSPKDVQYMPKNVQGGNLENLLAITKSKSAGADVAVAKYSTQEEDETTAGDQSEGGSPYESQGSCRSIASDDIVGKWSITLPIAK